MNFHLRKEMIKNKKTQALGYKGLMEANIKKEDYHHAFIYGEKLFQLNPFIDNLLTNSGFNHS